MLIEGTFDNPNEMESKKSDFNNILSKAKKFHENYLVYDSSNCLEKAIEYYIQAIKTNPEAPEAYYKLASLLWEKGEIDIEAAIKQCRKAVRVAPKSPTARLYMGYFFREAGNLKKAKCEFKKAVDFSGIFSAKPRIALGVISLEEKGFKSFLSSLYYLATGSVMLLWDINAVRMLSKSIIDDIVTMKYRTKANLFKMLKSSRKAVEVYEKALVKLPSGEKMYKNLADLSFENKEIDRAIDYYRSALKSSPDELETWLKFATALKQEDQDENIVLLIDCYNNLSRLQPQNSHFYYELGHQYLKIEENLGAVNSFMKAAAIDERNPFYANSLAYACTQIEDYEEAIRNYKRAIELNPDNKWTSVISQALGTIYHRVKNDFAAAVIWYRRAIDLDNNNTDAFLALAEAYEEKGENEEAIDAYSMAINLNPTDEKVYCRIAMALYNMDYTDEAVKAFKKALKINPKNIEALNNLGKIYMDKLQEPRTALELFEKATEAQAYSTLSYYNKGQACEELNMTLEAAEAYQMALNLNRIKNDIKEVTEKQIQERIYGLFAI